MANGVQPCGDDDEDEAEVPGVVTQPSGLVRPAVPASVLGLQIRNRPAVKAGAIAPGAVPRAARLQGETLPFTGAGVTGFLFIALGLVAAGWLMLKARRTS
jgi:hypothetical protein